MKSFRRMLGITWKDRKTNEWIWQEVIRVCNFETKHLIDILKKRKFQYFGHMVRRGGMTRAIMEGCIEGRRSRGRPMDNWHSCTGNQERAG